MKTSFNEKPYKFIKAISASDWKKWPLYKRNSLAVKETESEKCGHYIKYIYWKL